MIDKNILKYNEKLIDTLNKKNGYVSGQDFIATNF